ncbi:hypothetical protein BCR32DRAFT_283879 [Anaeromyces robustus]|uniref:CBM10 domain-containing protein n=1 Tax=Anaeromyces robustus TaxID=1754192 RepID=A0A1Y1WT39_9FUNG|nr:hypothetical protein BCR32DRAFT_283879 [Anaeromyces robustus]|eukprot:ORX76701.1 hypothetical protein BCR32DRAFT_283879 [Anaeromyces robustus]
MKLKRILSSFIIGSALLRTAVGGIILEKGCSKEGSDECSVDDGYNIISYCIDTSDGKIYGNLSDSKCLVSWFRSLSVNNDYIILMDSNRVFSVVLKKDMDHQDIEYLTKGEWNKLIYMICGDTLSTCERQKTQIIDMYGYSYEISSTDENDNRKLGIELLNDCGAESERFICSDINFNDIVNYCIADNNIYGMKYYDGGCKLTNKDLVNGYNLVVKTVDSFDIVEESDLDIKTDELLDKLFILKCDKQGNCSRGTGVITDSTHTSYEINEYEVKNKEIKIDLPDCSVVVVGDKTVVSSENPCSGTETIEKYCISGLGIYGVFNKNGDNCKLLTLEENTDNYIRFKDSNEFTIISDISSEEIEKKDDNILYKLFVMNCDGGGCTRVKRKFTDSVGLYYEISATKETENKKLKISIANNCDGKEFSGSEKTCTDSTNSNKDITNYCIHSNNLIYGFEDGASTGGCKVMTEGLSKTGDNLVRIINYKEFEILDGSGNSLNIKEDKLLYRLFIIRNNQGSWERGTAEIIDSTHVTYKIANDETKNEKVVLQINVNCNGKTIENNEVVCTDAANSDKNITHYCIHSDKVIYGFEDGATTCGCKVTDKVFENNKKNIVEIIGNNQFKIIENIEDEKAIEDKDDYILKKLFIVCCDGGGNCSRGTAKITDSIGYTYDIKTDETENEKMIVKIESSCNSINIDYSENCNSESIITNYYISGGFILGYNKNNNNVENKGFKITEYHKFDRVEASDLKIEEGNLLYRIFIVNCVVQDCERTGGEITDSTGFSFNIDAVDETKNSKIKIDSSSSSSDRKKFKFLNFSHSMNGDVL